MKEKLSLPKGWEIKTIGDVCVSASSNVSQNKLANDEGDYPIYGASGLIKKVSFYHQDNPYLSIVKDGSGVGRVTKMDAYTSVIGTLQYILPKENIDLDYLNYSLMSVDFKKYITGAAIPHIYFKDYKNEPFLWMPLPEQQRIVSILDEAFAAIAKAKANSEQNLKNAKELFESYLQGVFENKGDGWEEMKLGEVCQIIMGQSPKGETYNMDGNGVPLINGPVEFGPEPFSKTIMSKYTTEPTKYCKERDLILCVRGSTTGRINIAGFDACIGRGVAAIRYSQNQEWVNYFILSSRQKIYDLGTGATFPNVSGEILKNIPIPLPSLQEQQTIVRQLEALRAETQKLEAVYQKKIDDLEELKKSILQKAFAGELKTEKAVAV